MRETDENDHPGVYIAPPLAFLIAFFGGVFAGMGLDAMLIDTHLWLLPWALAIFAGFALIAVGLAFALWGAEGFFRRSAEFRTYRGTTVLVTDGAHGYSRNPMYLGLAMSLLGLGIACRALTLIIAALALFLYLDRYVIPREESYLARRFGEDFEDYRARIRKWI
ncbi:protein-S-isoprenylcysteine O-methyltransferase Ste14 [Rhizomicrobium palustre]|uniref:Protein-S-isoprenylcysteine O-methyltransferase Ste14 n=1 Tax=Rhizomicrobium palustre TaxID=189966 RepID=A0A846N3X0_9PROT|nr:isoprenylcysteine carboxylmethyltransferase family protein [Rhizomicrobium palustre]NIK90165.1 protein-S-isoprenylcysteine O-methyltransferase Ste14 [Rhizomicrobium palustre]